VAALVRSLTATKSISLFPSRAHDVAPDPSESVDAHFDRHATSPSRAIRGTPKHPILSTGVGRGQLRRQIHFGSSSTSGDCRQDSRWGAAREERRPA